MTRYLGGLITKDESLVIPADNYEDTAASGVWTLEEAGMLAKKGKWPTVGNGRPEALFMGRYGSGNGSVTIDYINITTGGDATDFGDISSHGGEAAACGGQGGLTA